MKRTIYIAGPMAGLPDNNYAAFDVAEEKLTDEGWFVVNPCNFDSVFGIDMQGRLLEAAMEAELAAIRHLDAIYLLEGWEKSKGARRELAVALENNLMVIVEGGKA